MRSLRGRLIVWQMLGITLFLATNGFAIHAIVGTHLRRELDRSLVLTARSLVPGLRREIMESELGSGRLPPGPQRLPTADSQTLFELRRADGETVLRSDALDGHSLPRLAQGVLVADLFDDTLDELRCVDVSLPPDGRPGRAVAFAMGPPPGRDRPDGSRPPWAGERRGMGRPFGPTRPGDGPGDGPGDADRGEARPTDPELAGGEGLEREGGAPRAGATGRFEVVLAAETAQLLARMHDLRLLLALAWVSCSLGSAAIISWVVHSGLRPLGKLSSQIEGLGGDRLQRRFDLPEAPAELAPVVDELNRLLDRIQRAFDREQAFTADAAHELRTPLAGLRSTLELALSRERSPREHRRSAQGALGIVDEMQALVSDLLFLSRGASSDLEARLEPVALAELAEGVLQRYACDARERGLTFDVDIDTQLSVRADPALLERVLSNLVENAVSYADERARIDLRARRESERIVFEIENPAAGAPADLAENAFLAFWRADSSRSMADSHAGLGLSLCKRIIEQLGGQIDAALTDGKFRIRLTL